MHNAFFWLVLLLCFLTASLSAQTSREPLGPSSRSTGLAISEIHYHPADRIDGLNLEFIEIYNSDPAERDLSGYSLDGEVAFQFANGFTIPGLGFIVVAADPAAVQTAYGIAGVLGPWTGSLDDEEGSVQLLNRIGARMLNVTYDRKDPWPIAADGLGHSLSLRRPSFGEEFVEAWGISEEIDGSPGSDDPQLADPLDSILINEWMLNASNETNFVELYNHSATPHLLDGCVLSDGTNSFTLPGGTIIPAGGFLVFDAATLGFNPVPGHLLLRNAAGTRLLDSVRTQMQQPDGVTGRFDDGYEEIYPLDAPTPGAENMGPRQQSIVLNEIMYNPLSGDSDDEYIELMNRSISAVDLSHWVFTDGIGYTIPTGTVIAAGDFLVIARDKERLIANYPQLNPTNCIGNYSGRLLNRGERIVLERPLNPATPTSDLIQEFAITYRDGPEWGEDADGGGSSLELIHPDTDGRLAMNWAASDETAKSSWVQIEHTGVLDNGRNTPDELHMLLLDGGACLIDNVEVIKSGETANRIPNPDFEGGFGNWLKHGNHIDSEIETMEGQASSQSLRLAGTSGGDNGVNRVETDLDPVLANGDTVTIRAWARWLRGEPFLLLRLHGNHLELSAELPVPVNLGTPGLPNSRLEADPGPAIFDAGHAPILPAPNEPITVTARQSDAFGTNRGDLLLRYRIDPATAVLDVPMLDDGLGGDAVAGDGIFSARIPGQPDDTMLAFRIESMDALSNGRVFPQDAPVREALIHIGEPPPCGDFGHYRLWMTEATIDEWASRQKLSNKFLPGTFVYGDFRVIYGAGGRYRGSPFIRPGYNGPLGNRCAYIWSMPSDDRMLGTTKLNLDSLEPNRDNTHLRERMSFWIHEQMDIPFSRQRYVKLFLNGQQREDIYADAQQPVAKDYIATWFPGEEDGHLHKIDDWFEFNDNASIGREFNVNGRLTRFTTTGGAYKQARYRWSWEKKDTGKFNDDYGPLFSLVDALNAPAAQYEAQVMAEVDIDNWLGVFAARHIVSDWDGYSYNRGKNMSTYLPRGGKWQMLPWDLDFAIGAGGASHTNSNIYSADDPVIDVMFANPTFRRMYLDRMCQAIDGPLLAANFDAEIDKWAGVLTANCVTIGNVQNVKNWIQGRRNYLINQIATAPFEITTNSGVDFSTTDNPVTIAGTAPVKVDVIEVNGIRYPVTWTSVTEWEIAVPLVEGTNLLNFVGLDRDDQPHAGATDSIVVTFTGNAVSPAGWVVINEIMYHPAAPGAEYVELLNRHLSRSFDLSGMRLSGVDFVFPPGTVIGPGEIILVVEDAVDFNLAYGAAPIVGVYDGNLDNGGENLRLLVTGAVEEVIDEVRYDDEAPWPTTADGGGPSLQLIDSGQDNNRVANWCVSAVPPFSPALVNICAGAVAPIPNIRINEVMPINAGFLQDNAGDFDPWVELVMLGGITTTSEVQFVDAGAVWHYLDDGSDQGTAWRTLDAAGAGWPSGPAQLGYGNNGEVTTVSFGPDPGAKYTTTYYRRDFNVTDPASITALNLQVRRDDGVVVYLNGTEIFRHNMPNGTIAFNTFAAGVAGGANETTWWPAVIDPGLLVAGNNQLAAEIHQVSFTSSDTTFDLQLSGTRVNIGGSIDMSQLYLTDDLNDLMKWQFPAGSTMSDGDFEIVWADAEAGETTASNWHADWMLDPVSGVVALVANDGGTPFVVDYLRYENISPDRSYGLIPDGNIVNPVYFFNPTPRGTNDPSATTNRVLINEWLASNTAASPDPLDGDFEDWFELYNPNPVPVDLSGYSLTDDLTDPDKWSIPHGTILGSNGFLLVWADSEPEQNGSNAHLHADFRLSINGEEIGLFAPDGSLVDSVTFGTQTVDVTEGDCPDGTGLEGVLLFPTPAAPNVCDSTNSAPMFVGFSKTNVVEHGHLMWSLNAVDAEAPPQVIAYTLGAGAPAGLTLDAGGLLEWFPTENDGPGMVTVTVFATDNAAFPLTGQTNLVITIDETNQPPELGFIGAQNVSEAQVLMFTATATDADIPVQSLVFSLDAGAPPGATMDPDSGRFTWTPGELDGGSVSSVTVRVTDSGSPAMSDFETFIININEANSPPVMQPNPTQFVVQGSTLMYTPQATDPDVPAQLLTWALDTNSATNISINAATGLITWPTSETNTPGPYVIPIAVTDDGAPPRSVTGLLTVVVIESNQPPVIDAVANQEACEGTQLTFVVTATDPDIPAQNLSFNLVAPFPAGASLDAASGVFQWTPGELDGGTSTTLTVRVTDNSTPTLSDTTTVFIAIKEVNEPPEVAADTNLTVNEEEQLMVQLNATDADRPAQAILWRVAGAPTNVVLETNTGRVTWTPTEAQGPADFPVDFIATDSEGASATQRITITVNEVPEPPVIVAAGPTSIVEGTRLQLTMQGSDPDLPAQALTWSLGAGTAEHATIDSDTGEIDWLTTESDGPGTFDLTVILNDDGVPTRSATQVVEVTVTESNRPPVISNLSPIVVDEGSMVQTNVAASDPDRPLQPLTWSLSPEAPANLTLNPNTGALNWPTGEAEGPQTAQVDVVVSDGMLSDTTTVSITVREVNQAPVMQPVTNQIVNEGNLLTVNFTATDADRPINELTWSLGPHSPAGLMLDAVTGQLTWTPTEAQGPSNALVQVIVSDGVGGVATQDVQIVVVEVGAPPEIVDPGPLQVSEGEKLQITLQRTDPDLPAQTLTWALATNAPTHVMLDAQTGELTWTPGELDGPTTARFDVVLSDDGRPPLRTTQTLEIVVAESNQPPVLAPLADIIVFEGETATVQTVATDPDLPAQNLSYRIIRADGTGASVNSSGTFRWVSGEAAPGEYTFDIEVSDNGAPSLTDQETVRVIIRQVPKIFAILPDKRIIINWNGDPDQRYRLEYCDNIAEGNWIFAGRLLPGATTLELDDFERNGGAKGFYRIVQE